MDKGKEKYRQEKRCNEMNKEKDKKQRNKDNILDIDLDRQHKKLDDGGQKARIRLKERHTAKETES
jgi:hypothetical protein